MKYREMNAIMNPNSATLTYTIRWMNGTIVKEIKEIYLPPGETI